MQTEYTVVLEVQMLRVIGQGRLAQPGSFGALGLLGGCSLAGTGMWTLFVAYLLRHRTCPPWLLHPRKYQDITTPEYTIHL